MCVDVGGRVEALRVGVRIDEVGGAGVLGTVRVFGVAGMWWMACT